MNFHHIELSIIFALAVISLIILVSRRLRIPYTIALVLAGIGFGFLHLFPDFHLTPSLLLDLFLPILLFEAGFHIQFSELREHYLPIAYLALGGVLITVLLAGPLITILWSGIGIRMTVMTGFFLASIVSATDPISVLAIMKRLNAPEKLSLLLEGESIFNDGLAVVLFAILMRVAAGDHFSLTSFGAEFLKVVLGGTAIGLACGALFSQITTWIDDHLIEITLTTVTAFSSYLLAEQVHVSGVLAVVTAGIFLGNIGGKHGMSPLTQQAVHSFWEYAVFVVNSFVFLLTGIEIARIPVRDYFLSGLIVFACLLAARFIMVWVGGTFFKLSARWRGLLFWGGIRGSLSLVLVLALPESFPMRDTLLGSVFSLVLSSLVIQGLTLRPLTRMLKLRDTDKRGT